MVHELNDLCAQQAFVAVELARKAMHLGHTRLMTDESRGCASKSCSEHLPSCGRDLQKRITDSLEKASSHVKLTVEFSADKRPT
jgi:hypothetical protein